MEVDGLLNGRLKLWQPVEGPKFSMDTALLASWVRVRARRYRFVELGSATGGVSLALGLRFPPPFTITGVEIQKDLYLISQQNILINGLENQVSFVHGDLRDRKLLPLEAFDGLVVNPPYGGRWEQASPVAARSIARQGVRGKNEVCCSLEDIAAAAFRLLKGQGRLFAIFRTARLVSFMTIMAGQGLLPRRLKMIHPRVAKPSNLFLVECMKAGGDKIPKADGLVVEPPLVVLGNDGKYTPELLRAYEI